MDKEEFEKLEKAQRDIGIMSSHLLHCAIIREEYTIKLLEFLFDRLGIEKPEANDHIVPPVGESDDREGEEV